MTDTKPIPTPTPKPQPKVVIVDGESTSYPRFVNNTATATINGTLCVLRLK